MGRGERSNHPVATAHPSLNVLVCHFHFDQGKLCRSGRPHWQFLGLHRHRTYITSPSSNFLLPLLRLIPSPDQDLSPLLTIIASCLFYEWQNCCYFCRVFPQKKEIGKTARKCTEGKNDVSRSK